MRSRLIHVLLVALACLVILRGSAQAGSKTIRWILNGAAMNALATQPDSVSFFAGTRPFVVAPKWRHVTIPQSWNAIPTQIFTSFREFSWAVKNSRIDPGIKAVLYDNEGWSLTPAYEQRDFAKFSQKFYELAHEHGYFVINTPALSLANPEQESGESRFDTFLRLNFLADAAKNADAIDIQAQGSQVPPGAYSGFVSAAARQARAANPNVLVFAGISTNPSGHTVTAQQITAAIEATKNVVDGYWFNIPQQGPSCPRCTDFRPDMAVDVLKLLKSRGT